MYCHYPPLSKDIFLLKCDTATTLVPLQSLSKDFKEDETLNLEEYVAELAQPSTRPLSGVNQMQPDVLDDLFARY